MWSVLERDITQIDYQGNLTYLEKAGKLKIASSPEAFLLLPKKKSTWMIPFSHQRMRFKAVFIFQGGTRMYCSEGLFWDTQSGYNFKAKTRSVIVHHECCLT